MEKGGCVYILASRRNGTLYTGVTSDLLRRVSEHRLGLTPGFATKHGVKSLVWFEDHGDIEAAISREKALKRWRRAWKIALIEETNPQWLDLWDSLNAVPEGPLSHLQRPERSTP
jgi:putative endonuclease